MSEPMKPMEIEQRSFEIITELLGNRVLDPENELVIKRVIHTTADFDYADNLTFSAARGAKGYRRAEEPAATSSPTRRWRKLASTRRSWRASAARCIASCPTPMSRRRRELAA